MYTFSMLTSRAPGRSAAASTPDCSAGNFSAHWAYGGLSVW